MVSRLVEKMLAGDRRALARLVTLLEQDPGNAPAIMKAVYPHAGGAYCLGVTGPPGAGKSTIVDGLVGIMRGRGADVGILAVDPTSPFTGGAVLGDRIRMQRHYLDPGVFVRSLATRGVHGGLSRVARASVKLLDAFGKEVVIVESVGVGQTELDIMKVADTVVVVVVPEAGDSVQFLKAGLMEIADLFVVNKADRVGAGRVAAATRAAIDMLGGEPWWRPPVLMAQAHKGDGIQALYDKILEHREAMEKSSQLERRRRERRHQEFLTSLEEAVEVEVTRLTSQDGALRSIAARVDSGELDPFSATALALDQGLLFHRDRCGGEGPPDPARA